MSLLVETLSERLQQPDDPFEPTLIVVQSQGIGQWLKVTLAERLGIAANIDCLLPAELIWRLYQNVLPDVLGHELPVESPFARNLLSWRLMQLLPNSQEPAIQDYLAGRGDPQLRCYQMSYAVASLFDQYLIYRPDWLAEWETHGQDAPIKWQSDFWRELRAQPGLENGLHRANLHQRFLETLDQADSQIQTSLPKQINLLGISSMPQMHLETFQAVAKHRQVSMYFLNPCEHYWGDIYSEKDLAKKSIRSLLGRAPKTESADEDPLDIQDYLEVGNPLLSSTGQQGREFLELLLETDGIQTADLFQQPQGSSALEQVQRDILNLEFGGEIFDVDRLPTPGTLKPDDHSIQIHSAHSRMREIEILLDQLLAMLDADSSLLGSDIIVMAPDIGVYAPFIEAVFSGKLPFSITDRAIVDESAIVTSFQKLIDLPDSRLTATEVMDFLEVPAIARRFQLGEADISRIHQWVRDSGIRFEVDGASKKQNWQLEDDDYNTWRFGLDRLLLGLTMEPDQGLFDATAPFDIHPGDAELLGQLCNIADLLAAYREKLSSSHTPEHWQSLIQQLLTAFFDVTPEEEIVLSAIADALEKLVSEHDQTHTQLELSAKLFRYWINRELQQPAQNRGFVTGKITFATLVPMRSIPYRCVCLLGMNDREFPREDKPLSFDLMARQYRKGDRSRRNDDRYLFLEAILSAEQTLYASYIGRGQKDNKEKPPSELLNELIDYLDRVFGAFPVTEHPLQPFAAAYYQGQDKLFTYAEHWHQGLESQDTSSPFHDQDLPQTATDDVIQLSEVTRFFRHPTKYFLNQRLGVYFNEDREILKDTESFSLDGLEQYQLADDALQTMLSGDSVDDWIQLNRATGTMLPGQLGEQQLQQELAIASQVAREVTDINSSLPSPHTFDISINDTLVACTVELRNGQYIAPRTGELRSRQLLEAWIHHLALCVSGSEQPSVLIYRKGSSKQRSVAQQTIAAIPAQQAREHLSLLLNHFTTGQSAPLKFLPEASKVYATKGNLDEVIKQFTSTRQGAEAQDPYLNRVFNFPEDFDEEFMALAGEVWQPLLDLTEKKLSKRGGK